MKAYVVETAAIKENIKTVLNFSKCKTVYAVLKENGYGLGISQMSDIMAKSGIRRFAVTDYKDAAAIKNEAKHVDEILMLRPVTDSDEIKELLKLGVTFTISSKEDAILLSRASKNASFLPKAHIKTDVGMGRYGFLCSDSDDICALYKSFPDIDFCGIYTHFPYCTSGKTTQFQYKKFCTLIESIEKSGFDPGIKHCCNSSAMFLYPDMHMDAVRVGSAFLGRIPNGESFGLKKTGHCETTVFEIKTLPSKHTVGYRSAYTTKKETRIALCSVGSHNGLGTVKRCGRLSFSVRLCSLLSSIKSLFCRNSDLCGIISEKKVPVLGYVGMGCTALDVTKIDCKIGSTAYFDINPLYINDLNVIYR